MDIDLYEEPLGEDEQGEQVYLKDIWPDRRRGRARRSRRRSQSDMFRKSYGEVFDGDERWNSLEVPAGDLFDWDEDRPTCASRRSSRTCRTSPSRVEDIEGARVLAVLGDSVTTDHISPAGSIKRDSPAGQYLIEHGVEPQGLQLLRLAPRQPRGDDARHVRQHPPAQPAGCQGPRAASRSTWAATDDGEQMSIYDAAMRYLEDGPR